MFQLQGEKEKNVPEESEGNIFDDILDLEEDGPTNEAVESNEAIENSESSVAVNKNDAKSPDKEGDKMEVDDNKDSNPELEAELKQTCKNFHIRVFFGDMYQLFLFYHIQFCRNHIFRRRVA